MSATATAPTAVATRASMLVLPSDMTFRFIAEPTITFRTCSSSSSSDDGYEDDDGGFHAPFTTSPLDECRGATKTAEPSRGVHLHATSSFAYTKKAARRRKNAKAATMRAGR